MPLLGTYTKNLLSNVERAEELGIAGWAMHDTDRSVTVSIDVHINGRFTARIPAATFRSDLESCYGSGYHAFFFNPLDYLTSRRNLIELFESSSGALLCGGARTVAAELPCGYQAYRRARGRSQSRWLQEDSEPTGPRGEWMFLKHLEVAAHFHDGLRILEVGSGEGHLLSLLLHRRKRFSSYLGLDLSRARIEALSSRFPSGRIHLLSADAARYPYAEHFDLVIASSVCDTLFPSFSPLLRNVCRSLPPGGLVAFDLLAQDDKTSISRAEWQGDRWLRLYSQLEIRRILSEAGLELLNLQIYEKTKLQHRVFVTALKLHSRPQNKFESA